MKKLFAMLVTLTLLLCGMAALAEGATYDEADLDRRLCGEWLECETQFTQMTIGRNPEAGWDVEIASPLTHGAYIFKTTIQYDADQHCFTYDKGKFWDVPITEDENPDLGEAKIAGTTGRLTFTGDEESPRLSWVDDQSDGTEVLFERAAAEVAGMQDEDEPTSRIVTPNNPEIDIFALADGIYPAAFEPADLADGALTFTVYWEDTFDIVEISRLAPGDSLYVDDTLIEVETVERDDDGDLLINGGLDEGGVTLRAYDEDNCWRAVEYDDLHTYFNWGETTLPLSDDMTFTDGWDIRKDPVTVTGAEAVAEAIAGTDMDAFIPENTTVRVEGGRIAEIVRVYIP